MQASSYLETWLKHAQTAGNEDMILVPEGSTAWTGDALSQRLSHYLRTFSLTIRPRDLRKSFSTHCENVLRVPSDALDMYLGQVGGLSALRARHYTATMIETLARDIVQPLENSLSVAPRKNVKAAICKHRRSRDRPHKIRGFPIPCWTICLSTGQAA